MIRMDFRYGGWDPSFVPIETAQRVCRRQYFNHHSGGEPECPEWTQEWRDDQHDIQRYKP